MAKNEKPRAFGEGEPSGLKEFPIGRPRCVMPLARALVGFLVFIRVAPPHVRLDRDGHG